MPPGWVVAVASPQAETKAVANARRLGFECFYPRIKRTMRRRGKRFYSLVPLFTSYFFVFITSTWSQLFEAHGIAGFLVNGENLAVVPEPVIKELKSRCDRDGVYIQPVSPRFRKGQRVKPKTGPFAGLVGSFEGKQDDAAFFDLFGQKTRVVFVEGDLVAA